MKPTILIVEDDSALRTTLCDRLRGEHYEVAMAKDAEEAMEKINVSPFDLLIVDVMLPYHNGFDLCRELRQSGLATPIMFLTAKTALVDKIVGLKLGGDDYMTKPFEAEELCARVESLLRRSPAQTGRPIHEVGNLRVDVPRRKVTRDGKPVDLTEREFQLLCYLLDRSGLTVPRRELLRAVWGYNLENYSRTVDVHICSLRQKLEEDPSRPVIITTVARHGYKVVARRNPATNR
jgi:two-component system, OmpR family, alkaline phosphatase synthesis response regulator PhoP